MKRKLLAMLMTAAMVCSLTACGGNADAGDAAGTGTDDGTVSDTSDAGDADTGDAGTDDTDAEEGSTGNADAGSSSLTGTLKLGLIGPLTGGAALYGNAVDGGTSIAVDEINAISSDFQIELNSQDDEHDAEKSVNAYNNLKDWDAQAVIGCVTTTPCVAVASEAYADRMFMLTPSASATSVTEGKDNVFQLCFADPNQGSASAQYIFDHNLAEKIAVIYNNSDAYSTGIYQTFQSAADGLGMEIVSVTTFTDDTANDFSVQLTEAQNAGADLVFLPIYYTPASLIMQQAASSNYSVTFFGVDGMDGILSLEGFDTSLAEGVMLLTPFSADAQDDATVSFVKKYQDAHSEVPSQFAADGYDCAYAIYAALSYYADKNGGFNVDGVSYSELCEILVSVFADSSFSVDGITGEGMTWTATGEVNKAPKAVVIENGVYVGL
ncbi:MAG: ABC transporter substrate-binding protein [Blautia sp.]|nr:ABC transporter substrate-binding protein [Lachnoclostridium sp.]MCM1212415.1 ABC transporter substrate-binding protein [Blautia sp.]